MCHVLRTIPPRPKMRCPNADDYYCSVRVWSECLVRLDRSKLTFCLSSTASILCHLAAVCRSMHTQLSFCNYTLPHHTLLPTHSHRFPTIKLSPQIVPSTPPNCNHHTMPPVKQRRIPSFSQQQLTNSGSVVITSSQIAAASPRALPARAAHLSGWTHRLRAAPAPSTAHSTQLSIY